MNSKDCLVGLRSSGAALAGSKESHCRNLSSVPHNSYHVTANNSCVQQVTELLRRSCYRSVFVLSNFRFESTDFRKAVQAFVDTQSTTARCCIRSDKSSRSYLGHDSADEGVAACDDKVAPMLALEHPSVCCNSIDLNVGLQADARLEDWHNVASDNVALRGQLKGF